MLSENAKALRDKWLRSSGALVELIGKRQDDLKRLTDGGQTSKTILDKIDYEIDVMVSFYNNTHDIINDMMTEASLLNIHIALGKKDLKDLQEFYSEAIKGNDELEEQLIQLISKQTGGSNNGKDTKKKAGA